MNKTEKEELRSLRDQFQQDRRTIGEIVNVSEEYRNLIKQMGSEIVGLKSELAFITGKSNAWRSRALCAEEKLGLPE